MNTIHNIIWSVARNSWIVVAEGTKSTSKSGRKALKLMAAMIFIFPAASFAATLPQGGSIIIGDGAIISNGSNQLTIKQNTDKLGINWQSFNVGADGHVIFDQPGTNSIALNRVIGSDGSAILGKISANGQVFLINPNGVIFGKDSKVNVGGLVASTLNISDEDFKNGNFKFTTDTVAGEVINNGRLEASEGGYIAMLGRSVKNNGVIQAKLGTAALAAGGAVTLDFSGDGLINVQVDKSAIKALSENKGLIQADGGQVLMTARASNALLDTVVNNEGIVQAQTIGSRGGKIFLDGGMDSGTVQVAGTLDASAPTEGNGGFIETSGANVIIANGTKVTTLANKGKTGEWLIDPTDFNIVSGTGPLTSSQIGATTLANSLATTNVTLQTSAVDNGQAGDINVNANVTWASDSKLTLNAHNMVNFHADVVATGTNAGIAINSPWGYSLSQTGARIRLPGANSTFSVNGLNYTLIRNAADLALLSNAANNQHFAIVDDIDASVTSGWNSGKGYTPPGGWDRGVVDGLVLDGFNNSITNLRINLANDYSGLIGYASNASIGNLKLNATVDGFQYTGMLAGYLKNSTVYNVSTSGTVNGTNADDVGGVVGHADNLTMRNVTNYATVAGTNNVGGLIGYSTGSNIIYSYNLGSSVTGKDADSDYTGGFVGYAQNSSFEGIMSTAQVNGANFAGGLFGMSKNNTITTAMSTGAVVGVQATGGLIGIANGGSLSQSYTTSAVNGKTQTGGLIGKSTNLAINNVYTTADVTGTTYTGGLIGDLSGGTINQAFSTSKVVGTNYVGGFAGRDVSGAITNAYASGPVMGTRYVGGFFGSVATAVVKFTYSLGLVSASQNYGGYSGSGTGNTITESYWDTQSSGQATSVHGIGKTTAQMHSASTFANWNIGTQGGTGEIWRIYDGFTGPLMRFVMATVNVSANDKTLTYSGHAVTTGELNAGSPYGYSTGSDPYSPWYNLTYASRADIDLEYILGGNTYGGGLAIRNAGTYTADKFYSTQFGYDIVETAPKTITVNKANLNISATGTSKTYDGTTTAGTALSDNRLGSDTLVIGSSSSSFADKNAGTGKTVTVNGITVTGADALNYTWNTSATTTADIAKANLTIGASGVDKTYDGTTAAGANLTDNRFGSDILVISASGKTFADKNAGVGKVISVNGITVTGADAANYTWNTTAATSADIAKATLSVTASGVNKTYDGTMSAGANLSDNRFGTDSLIVSSTDQTFSDKNAGIGKSITVNGITVTGADAANYTWNTTAVTTADIAKANLTVTAAGVNKTYDGTTGADVSLSDNRIGSDDLVLAATDSTFSDKNAGSGKTVSAGIISVTGADAANYTWNTYATTTADISKANLNITASGVGKTYDGTTTAGATLEDNRLGSDDLVLSSAGNAFTDKNAGVGKTITVSGINVTGADAGNYTWNTSITTTGDIAKATLSVVATGSNKIYDGTTAAGSSLSDNRIGSDDLVVTSSSSEFSDKNAGAGKVVTVGGINVAGADSGNYTWNTSAATSADIGKRNLTIEAAGANKVYDGTTSAGVTLKDNRIVGDSLAVGGSAIFGDKNAGVNKNVSVSGISVDGADSDNYTWNSTAVTTADISKANLTVSASGSNKTYDGKASAGTTLSDNRLGSDDLVIGSTGSSFADKNAGSNKLITVSGIMVSGADASNYVWNTVATATGTINKAILSVITEAHDKAYDGTTGALVSFADNRISGDQLTISASDSSFDNKNAGAGKAVSTSGIKVGGADAQNYEWNASATSSADISKATLTIKANSTGKVVGAQDGALGWSITGGSLFGSDGLQGELTRGPGEAAGSYSIGQGSLTAGPNYTLMVVPGNFEISRPSTNVELEETKDIISTITVTQKAAAPKTDSSEPGKSKVDGVIGDYRLLNLGMKLPEDLFMEESTKI